VAKKIASELVEMRADQFLLWQTWCSILKLNAHIVRDTRLNIEISQLSLSFLVPNPETYPVDIEMLVLDFDDDVVTASLTTFTRTSMRSQGDAFNLLRTATFNWSAPGASFTEFLADFGVKCSLEQPKMLPPGYFYKD
jgi:hypothetical protein